jgi:2-hydroxychromene-2-carboxylate isomerase
VAEGIARVFSANGVAAVRIALAAPRHSWTAVFTKAVFATEFSTSADIGDKSVPGAIHTDLGLDANVCLAEAEAYEIKQ